MASLSYAACYGSGVDNESILVKRASLASKNSLSPLFTKREKQSFDPYRLGLIIDDTKYRQTYAIRISDVGPDKATTIESILNIFQETKSNQLRLTGLIGNGFGTTHEMIRNNLIWVLTRMEVEVDHYPKWGDIVDIDTWFVESKGLSFRRDWIVRCHTTGLVFVRGTSTWVMMNHETRRLARNSKIVKDELSLWFDEDQVMDSGNEKIEKLDIDKAIYTTSNIKPKRSDLDMNNHVNNIMFLRWMLEAMPDCFLEAQQLCSIVLEYKKECQSSDIVESLVGPHEDEMILDKDGRLRYTHLLQTNGENKGQEIVRAWTTWKRNLC